MNKDQYLSHWGVKGMKWGARKKYNQPNPGYTKKQRTRDKYYSEKGVKRINKNMNKGMSYRGARSKKNTNNNYGDLF